MTRPAHSSRNALPALLLQAVPVTAEPGDGGRPAFVYVVALVLGVVALYLIIRLFVWDRANAATPNQEEPIFGENEERKDHD